MLPDKFIYFSLQCTKYQHKNYLAIICYFSDARMIHVQTETESAEGK